MIGTEKERGRTARVRARIAVVLAMASGFAFADAQAPARASAWDAPMCASGGDPAAMYERSEVGEPLACVLPPAIPAYVGALRATETLGEVARLDTARRAFVALAAHREAGRDQDALVSLATLRAFVPELADRWDAIEGELRVGDARGCAALERATSSPTSAVAARARVGMVRCLLETGAPTAERELRALLTRYPDLPTALDLRLLEASQREARGDVRGAIAAYREIDLGHADTHAAGRAREALARLEAEGHRVPSLAPEQLVARADRIVRLGPPELAREEIERLLASELPARQRSEVTLLAARLARVEGRFRDADALTRAAQGDTATEATVRADVEAPALPVDGIEAEAARRQEAQQEAVRQELRALLGTSRTLARAPSSRLFAYLRHAARRRALPELASALAEVSSRSLPCGLRLEAAVVATGTASDEVLLELLGGCVDAPSSVGAASRYHRARALERLGRRAEAREDYLTVLDQDRSETRWYALWARQHLRAAEARPSEATWSPPLDPTRVVTPLDPSRAPSLALESPGRPADVTMERSAMEAHLEALARAHGAYFPWFARALAHLRLGDDAGVTEELHEAFLAWHEARGNAPLRAGVEAVYRGATPPRRSGEPAEVVRARRALSAEELRGLADIAATFGDHGLAVRFGGRSRASARPRAYEDIVVEVANARGLDPNLLLAVMRVESIYNPRIVSYAGAVGLMQIMPRTGRLIARSMQRESSFGTDDLLDPRTNIEFAAWYLSSLVRRFDGRVPLAVASYNGGPHNVRRWLDEHSSTMPLDAFLERIPFTQTHRYVRRVLSHWAAYRAQEGLPMVELDPTLPELGPDRVAF